MMVNPNPVYENSPIFIKKVWQSQLQKVDQEAARSLGTEQVNNQIIQQK